MASNYSSSSLFFAPTRKSRRTRTIRFFDENNTNPNNYNADSSSSMPEPPASPKDIAAADLKLAMELQREENLLALREAAKRRHDQIQAGRNRTGRSCAHGFGLGTKGVACHADRDLIAEQQESERAEAEAGAVEVRFVADGADSSSSSDCCKTDADTHSTCSDASSMGSTPPRRPRSPRRRTRQSSAGAAAMRGVAPPLGYRLNYGLTENPRSDDEEDNEDDHHDDEIEDDHEAVHATPEDHNPRSGSSSPLQPTTNTHMDAGAIAITATEEDDRHSNQDCSSTSSSTSTPTKRNTSSASPQHNDDDDDDHSSSSPYPPSSLRTSASTSGSLPSPPPSILRNRLTKRPPSDLNLVGRVGTADTVDTVESTEATTPTAASTTATTTTHKQPAWLEEMERERALRKNAEDTGKAAQKLLADAIRHNDSARRRSGFGLFAPTWGTKGSPGRSGGGSASYDRRNLPTTY